MYFCPCAKFSHCDDSFNARVQLQVRGEARTLLLMLPQHFSVPGLAEHSTQSAGDVGGPHRHDRDVVQLHGDDPGSPDAAADRRAGA